MGYRSSSYGGSRSSSSYSSKSYSSKSYSSPSKSYSSKSYSGTTYSSPTKSYSSKSYGSTTYSKPTKVYATPTRSTSTYSSRPTQTTVIKKTYVNNNNNGGGVHIVAPLIVPVPVHHTETVHHNPGVVYSDAPPMYDGNGMPIQQTVAVARPVVHHSPTVSGFIWGTVGLVVLGILCWLIVKSFRK